MTDQPNHLINEMKRGNERAFAQIYQKYHMSLLGVINTIVRNDDVAQEILQDVFLKIWDKCATYDVKQGRFYTWALNISRNASIDYLRSKNHKNDLKNLSRDFHVGIVDGSTNMDNETDFLGLKKWINKLEPLCISIIDTIFFKGFTFKDGATQLEMPEGSLKTKHRKCIKDLRLMLEE